MTAAMANRHGLITGATGTGKTVSLQLLAESFSRLGVPVFAPDIKGDLSGIGRPGSPHPKVSERLSRIGIDDHRFQGSPLRLWDVHAARGHAVRTTVSEMGPVLLANLLELNETQEGVLHTAFAVADDQGLLLLDLKDLRAMLNWISENSRSLTDEYGRVSAQSVGAILRRLLVLEEAGGDRYFGEPALRIEHLMERDADGRGIVSLLDATALYHNPRIYATFLLWLLSELMEQLPERGDAPLPTLVFFFDEAHLLFERAPGALLERIGQTVRLIRSKGVGVFFVTQYPSDVPEQVLGQLGNRVQHALRAFTPRDRKSLRAAAETFRPNPAFDTAAAIAELGVGEALVSTLDGDGVPSVVERTLIAPPRSRIGPLSDAERQETIETSPLRGVYDTTVDRESAFERLKQRAAVPGGRKEADNSARPRGRSRQSMLEAFAKSLLRSIGSGLGRRIARGILGSISAGR